MATENLCSQMYDKLKLESVIRNNSRLKLTPLCAQVLLELWELNWRCENRLNCFNEENVCSKSTNKRLKALLVDQQRSIARGVRTVVAVHRIIALIYKDFVRDAMIFDGQPHAHELNDEFEHDRVEQLARRTAEVIRAKQTMLSEVNKALEDGVDVTSVLEDIPPVDSMQSIVEDCGGLRGVDPFTFLLADKLLVCQVVEKFTNCLNTTKGSLQNPLRVLQSFSNSTAELIRLFLGILETSKKVRSRRVDFFGFSSCRACACQCASLANVAPGQGAFKINVCCTLRFADDQYASILKASTQHKIECDRVFNAFSFVFSRCFMSPLAIG